jgi:hypothetical protein
LWLNDSSSVTDAGSGACSQWNDISGNGWHMASALASTTYPSIIASGLDGKRTIRFDGSNDRLYCAPGDPRGIFRNVSGAFALAVYKKMSADGSPTARALFSVTNGTDGATRCVANAASSGGGANTPALAARRLDGDSTVALIGGSAVTTSWAVVLWRMDYANGDGYVYINGDLSASNTSFTSDGNTSDTASARAVMLGAFPTQNTTDPSAQNFSDIEVAELIVGTTLTGAGEIDKLFGYAHHRWGLTSLLDSGHPYKSVAPTV